MINKLEHNLILQERNNMINNRLELRMLIHQLKRQLMSNLIVTNFLKSFRSII